MTSRTTADFWKLYENLPPDAQKLARDKFRLWRADTFNASLHFKPLFEDVWSVRINQSYRALARRHGDLIVWFWIGSHADYDHMLKRL